MSFKFSKAERICSKYEIDALFAKGKSFRSETLLLKVIEEENQGWPYQKYLISVPKRKIKKAVDRNRVKRKVKEIIRLNKKQLERISNKRLLIAVIYQSAKELPYALIEKDYLRLIKKLVSIENKIEMSNDPK